MAEQTIESEGLDRYNITLPGFQEELINQVAAASKGPVIVVVRVLHRAVGRSEGAIEGRAAVPAHSHDDHYPGWAQALVGVGDWVQLQCAAVVRAAVSVCV